MEKPKSLSMTNNRITVIDALRGFALLGVLLTHMISRFAYFTFTEASREPLFSGMDSIVGWINTNMLTGRFVNIFAFLFGLSFFIQMDRAAAKGVDFRRRFLWRMVILYLIGVANTILFSGDILTLYALFGVIMVALYKWRNWSLMLLSLVLLCGGPRLSATFLLNRSQSAPSTEVALTDNGAAAEDATPKINPAEWSAENNPAREFAEKMGLQTFADTAKMNLVSGLFGKILFQIVWTNRGYITLALFILGLIIGRLRFFETVHLHPRRNLVLLGAFAAGLVAVNLSKMLFPQDMLATLLTGGAQSYESVLYMSLEDLSTVFFSATLVMAFVVLYQLPAVGRCLAVLAPYGRMGLTNYVAQSVIGVMLFAPWAFGATFAAWSVTAIFLLGLVIYVAQIVVSAMWLKYFKYGPLEWFWRTATYMKIQPFKK